MEEKKRLKVCQKVSDQFEEQIQENKRNLESLDPKIKILKKQKCDHENVTATLNSTILGCSIPCANKHLYDVVKPKLIWSD